MRLTLHHTEQILATVRRHFGADALVAVLGSRLDDAARGGDVDLLVEAAAPTQQQRAWATMELEGALQLPVDIVAVKRGAPASPLACAARAAAAPLER